VKQEYNLICIMGHTAGGKTAIAAQLADKIKGEIISADSRQVYKHMNIGTGKDYNDYWVNGKKIPYHLIDIVEPGYQYNIFEYQRDFIKAFQDIKKRNKQAIMCGGSGMYIEAILKGYKLINVPVNNKLRKELQDKSLDELKETLAVLKKMHNKTDTDTKKRAIRAIEIEKYYQENNETLSHLPDINSLNIGIAYNRENRRERITQRLEERLANGMIDEVKQLLDKGLTPDQLIYYGLEYKFLTLYLTGNLNYDEMKQKLNTAIHQFAKRQMTWFRRMQRKGIEIHWIDGYLTMKEKVEQVLAMLKS